MASGMVRRKGPGRSPAFTGGRAAFFSFRRSTVGPIISTCRHRAAILMDGAAILIPI